MVPIPLPKKQENCRFFFVPYIKEGMGILTPFFFLRTEIYSLLQITRPRSPSSLTLVPPPPTQTELVDKKRKWDKKGGKGSAKEGEIQEETPPKQAKVAKVTRSQQRRGGETSKMVLEHRPHVYNWNTPYIGWSPISCRFINPHFLLWKGRLRSQLG